MQNKRLEKTIRIRTIFKQNGENIGNKKKRSFKLKNENIYVK